MVSDRYDRGFEKLNEIDGEANQKISSVEKALLIDATKQFRQIIEVRKG